MAHSIVRHLDDAVVRQRKIRAARPGRSAEAEHRAILCEALLKAPPPKSLKTLLPEMPADFEDAVLERGQGKGRGEVQL